MMPCGRRWESPDFGYLEVKWFAYREDASGSIWAQWHFSQLCPTVSHWAFFPEQSKPLHRLPLYSKSKGKEAHLKTTGNTQTQQVLGVTTSLPSQRPWKGGGCTWFMEHGNQINSMSHYWTMTPKNRQKTTQDMLETTRATEIWAEY